MRGSGGAAFVDVCGGGCSGDCIVAVAVVVSVAAFVSEVADLVVVAAATAV